MRAIRFVPFFLALFSVSQFAVAQENSAPPPPNSAQATTLLAQSLAVLSGHVSFTDVTVSGTVRRIAGSDDEAGTGVFKALASGAGRMDLSLSSGQRAEVQNLIGATPTGSWSGPDTVSHAIAYHNLLAEPIWFFPAFAISRRLSSTGYLGTYVGPETHNGQAVEHVSVSQTSPVQDSAGAPTFQHLTQVEFLLDSTTLLPSAISFYIHPDNNALLDIPVEVRFSDYRSVNGAQVPFHVQKFLNNSLILDLQATSVTLNSGLPSTTFNAQ